MPGTTYHRSMDNEDLRLAKAISVLFEAEGDSAPTKTDARNLLKLARRGESEMALRKEVADLQSRTTHRVIDSVCRRVVEVIKQVTDA